MHKHEIDNLKNICNLSGNQDSVGSSLDFTLWNKQVSSQTCCQALPECGESKGNFSQFSGLMRTNVSRMSLVSFAKRCQRRRLIGNTLPYRAIEQCIIECRGWGEEGNRDFIPLVCEIPFVVCESQTSVAFVF